jgi:ribonuclease E
MQPIPEDATEEPHRSYFTPSPEPAAPQTTVTAPVATAVEAPATTPIAAAAPTATTPAPMSAAQTPVATATGMPKLQPFELPVTELTQVAQNSGLSWVNSDTEKVASVQAAIAIEPKTIHVPRERPPVVQIDTGPLVLVETKRDLRNMTLPFEEKEAQ